MLNRKIKLSWALVTTVTQQYCLAIINTTTTLNSYDSIKMH